MTGSLIGGAEVADLVHQADVSTARQSQHILLGPVRKQTRGSIHVFSFSSPRIPPYTTTSASRHFHTLARLLILLLHFGQTVRRQCLCGSAILRAVIDLLSALLVIVCSATAIYAPSILNPSFTPVLGGRSVFSLALPSYSLISQFSGRGLL